MYAVIMKSQLAQPSLHWVFHKTVWTARYEKVMNILTDLLFVGSYSKQSVVAWFQRSLAKFVFLFLALPESDLGEFLTNIQPGVVVSVEDGEAALRARSSWPAAAGQQDRKASTRLSSAHGGWPAAPDGEAPRPQGQSGQAGDIQRHRLPEGGLCLVWLW